MKNSHGAQAPYHSLLKPLEVLPGLFPTILHHPETATTTHEYLSTNTGTIIQRRLKMAAGQHALSLNLKAASLRLCLRALEISMSALLLKRSVSIIQGQSKGERRSGSGLEADGTHVRSCSLRLFSWSVDRSFSCSTLRRSCSSMIFWFRLGWGGQSDTLNRTPTVAASSASWE